MKKILSVTVFLLVSFLGYNQVMVDVDVKMTNYTSGKKLSGATVQVLSGSSVVKSANSPSNGNVKFKLPAGKKYKLVFSKPGKVSRFIRLDASDITKEGLSGAKAAKMVMQVSLFDELANIDYSYIENNPITEFYYEGSPELVYDDIIANRMRKKIEALMAETEKKESQNEAKYQKAIQSADSWYKQKKYDLALAKYEEALMLKPKEKYPAAKIKELDALLKASKQNELVEKQKEELYKKTVASANTLRDQKKYNEALAKYNEALKLKNEQFVKEQIASIKKTVEKEKKEKEAQQNLHQKIDKENISIFAVWQEKNFPL